MKTQTQLRIVKRDGLFVVQIRKQRFWTRRWWWQDMADYCEFKSLDGEYGASMFCDEYLKEERSKNNPDVVVKTYNTGFELEPPETIECDTHIHGDMPLYMTFPAPNCNTSTPKTMVNGVRINPLGADDNQPPPPPPPRNVKWTYHPPIPPNVALDVDGTVWINKPTKGDDDE